jgi:hypothetical protein
MTSSAFRVLETLTRSRFAGLVLSRLPAPVAETLRSLGEDLDEGGTGTPESEEVRRGNIDRGVRGSAFAIGDVLDGASVRGVNVVKGTIRGGSLRAVNLVLGDVLAGELRAVNVIVGDVRGGTLRDVHLIVGDVYDGELERCYAVIGDVRGGRGRVSRVLGEVSSTEVECAKQIDPRLRDQ